MVRLFLLTSVRYCPGLTLSVSLAESHTGIYLKEVLKEVADRWAINGKLVCATTDAAANIVKAIRECKDADIIDESHRCCCHTIHLAVTHALEVGDVKDLLKLVKDIVTLFRRSHNLAVGLNRAQ